MTTSPVTTEYWNAAPHPQLAHLPQLPHPLNTKVVTTTVPATVKKLPTTTTKIGKYTPLSIMSTWNNQKMITWEEKLMNSVVTKRIEIVIDTFFLFSCLCFRLYFLYRPNLLLSTVLFVSDFECRFSFLLHYLSLHNFVSVISSSNRFITCTSGASKYDAKISSKIERSADCKDNRPKK